jgi:hypothetical protein
MLNDESEVIGQQWIHYAAISQDGYQHHLTLFWLFLIRTAHLSLHQPSSICFSGDASIVMNTLK